MAVKKYWEQAKKKRTINLTDFAWDKLKSLAEQAELSVSEYVEQLMRKNNEY